MSQIDLSAFVTECVRQGLFLGVNPHYTAALAIVRSGGGALSNDKVGDAFGPYRLKADDWERRRVANDIDGWELDSDDISSWRFQCAFATLTAFRAQQTLQDKLGRSASALELYAAQWPDDLAVAQDVWQKALDAMADPVAKSLADELNAPPLDDAKVTAPDNPVEFPTPDPTGPEVAANEKLFVAKAPVVMTKLMAAFQLQDFQAAGIVGNIGHECGGFLHMQEIKPKVGLGGLGWAQWTGPRRTAFVQYCSDHGLPTNSDAGNLGYLMQELRTTQSGSIVALKKAVNLAQAVDSFQKEFERAGVVNEEMRMRWATLALAAFGAPAKLPLAVALLLDPDLSYKVLAIAKDGDDVYWLIEQIAEHGGQLVVKQSGATAQAILQATAVFPFSPGALPAAVAAKFGQVLQPPPIDHGGVVVGPGSVDQVAAKMFAQAKASANRLITHNVQGTNGGRLACAWAVNHIASVAVGKQIGGGLNSDAMAQVLQAHHTRIGDGDLVSGAIVISPSANGRTGHVGIVGEPGATSATRKIYSNSSSHGMFMQNFSVGSWKNYFAGRGLEVRFYLFRG